MAPVLNVVLFLSGLKGHSHLFNSVLEFNFLTLPCPVRVICSNMITIHVPIKHKINMVLEYVLV